MLADDFGVGDEVKEAFAQLGSGDLEVLRPLLRERAQSEVGDVVLAGLVAQQVLLDLSSRTLLDFAAPADLAAWLAIRIPQTAALFLGAVAPLSAPSAPTTPGGLRSAWSRIWSAAVALPTLAAATAMASIGSASAAILLTATIASPPATLGPAMSLGTAPPSASSPRVLPVPSPRSAPIPRGGPTPAPSTSAPVPSTLAPVSVSSPKSTTAPPATPTTPPPAPPSPPPTATPPPSPTPSPGCGGQDQGPPGCPCPGGDDHDGGGPPGCHCPANGDGCHHHHHHPPCGQPTAAPPTPAPGQGTASPGNADRPGS
jgi:hypothetical protein